MSRRLKRICLLGLPAALLLAAVLVPVRGGTVAVRSWRRGGTPEILKPGLALRLPFVERIDVFPGGIVAVEGRTQAASREGSVVALPYTARARPAPQSLLEMAKAGGEGGARAALATAVDEQLRQAAAMVGTYDLASGTSADILASATRSALEDRFGAGLELRLGPPVAPPDVLASFAREAIFGRRADTGLRVLLFGIDGADWDIIDPLIARGQLPNLARLKRQGAWGKLKSSVPTLSPLLWTTIATGKAPDRHGIDDFLVADPVTGQRVPINSTFRKTRALWNIVSEAGMRSDTIAWWATWPAESVTGHLISDRIAYSTFDLAGPAAGRGAVYPPDYAPTVERLRVTPENVTLEIVGRFIRVGRQELVAARKPGGAGSERRESIGVLTRVLASTETYRRVALDLLRSERGGEAPRLFAVYFQGVDEVNHRFAHCAPPRMSLCSENDYRSFQGTIEAFYRYQDEILGDILRAAPGTTVLVVSDHGFATGRRRPDDVKPFIEGKPGLWHELTGIFLAAGPGIGRGEIPTVTLYDIAPTVLHLLGLPLAEDMPGKIPQSLLDEAFAARTPIEKVPSYEGLGPRTPAAGATEIAEEGKAAEQEMVEQLRSLGYIGGESSRPPDDKGAGIGVTPAGGGVPTLLYHTNLGTVLLGKRQYDRAESEFLMALRFDRESPQALSGLAILYEAKGEPEKALDILRRLVALDAGTDRGALIKLAEIFIQLGRPEDGVLYLEALKLPPEARDKSRVGLRIAQGMLLAASGRQREAETALLEALRLEPTSTHAMQELFSLYDAQGRAAALESRLRQSLARDPRLPMYHNWLGLALKRKGDLDGARAEFERALELAPDLVGTMANLGSLDLQAGKVREAAALLQRAVEKDPTNIESRTNLIVALGMNRDLEGARAQVEEAAGLGLRSPLFHNAMAYALHVNGRDEEALASLRDALRIDPRQPDALRLQAEIESARRSMDPYR